jgi:RNA polymerase sigma-70 factor (ECF subfamily)
MKRARPIDDDAQRARRAAWMARAQNGDVAAYSALLDDIGPLVLRFLVRRIPDANDVQDAYQDVFAALHRSRHTYEPSRPFEPWLFAIVRHVAGHHARRRRRRAVVEVAMETMPEQAVPSEDDLRQRVERVVDRLPPAQREAFVMLKLEGLSITEAAARAGTTPGALKVRAHRAYQALKTLLRS